MSEGARFIPAEPKTQHKAEKPLLQNDVLKTVKRERREEDKSYGNPDKNPLYYETAKTFRRVLDALPDDASKQMVKQWEKRYGTVAKALDAIANITNHATNLALIGALVNPKTLRMTLPDFDSTASAFFQRNRNQIILARDIEAHKPMISADFQLVDPQAVPYLIGMKISYYLRRAPAKFAGERFEAYAKSEKGRKKLAEMAEKKGFKNPDAIVGAIASGEILQSQNEPQTDLGDDQVFYANSNAQKVEMKPDMDTPERADMPVSSEQKKVLEAVIGAADTARKAHIQAEQKAGEQLKELRAKKLVALGMKKIGIGAGLGFVTEKLGDKLGFELGYRSGAASAGPDEPVHDIGDVLRNATKRVSGGMASGIAGSLLGEFLGFESTGPIYNATVARNKSEQEKIRWYETIIGQAGYFMPLDVGKVSVRLLNPVTASGLKDIAIGLWQMGRG